MMNTVPPDIPLPSSSPLDASFNRSKRLVRVKAVSLTFAFVPARALVGQSKLIVVRWALSQRFQLAGLVVLFACQLDCHMLLIVGILHRGVRTQSSSRIPFGGVLCGKNERQRFVFGDYITQTQTIAKRR